MEAKVFQALLYFVIGLLQDVLGTLDTQAIIDIHPWKSAFISFIMTVLGVYVFAGIVLSDDMIGLTAAYALGGAVGSYYAVKRKR